MEGERGAYPFIVNRSAKFISEERNGISFTRIPGRFSVCDSVNGNNRRYPKRVWEKNLNDGSLLKVSIAKNGAFGLLEHPADGRISLQSPICILVTDAKLQTGQDESSKQHVDEVVGEIIVLNTAEGQKLRALIEVGYNPLVSSRGFGSVVKASDGVDEVQEDYVCEGWDVVLKPSFERAELFVSRESKSEAKQESVKAPAFAPAEPPVKVLAESKGVNMWCVFQSLSEKEHKKSFNALTDSEAEAIVAKVNAMTQEERVAVETAFSASKVSEKKDLPQAESSSAAEAALVAASANKQMTDNIMTINEIKTRIGAVKGTQVPKEPARFAEGLNELATIHQEIANFIAEDAKRNWQGQQLHEEVSRIERAWSESALAPSKAAVKLNENYAKVLKVTKVLGEAAIGIRKKLSETLAQNAEAAQLVEELTERGQAWVAIADKRKEQNADLNHKLEVACEALDIIKTRYHEDMTEMGRHVITLEFAEKAQTPEVQKLLKEAKVPKDIIAIRKKLDPEAALESKGCKCGKVPCECKKKNESNKGSDSAAASLDENKKKAAAPAGETAPALGEARVLVPSVRSISESVAMVQRLSTSATEKLKEEAPKK
jgi:hypothetical protein